MKIMKTMLTDLIHTANFGIGAAYIMQALPPKPWVIILQVVLSAILPAYGEAIRSAINVDKTNG